MEGSKHSNQTGMSKLFLVKVKAGDHPEQWTAKNELLATATGTDVTLVSSSAKMGSGQNSAKEPNVAGNAPATAAPSAQAASGCAKLSGMAKFACETGSSKLGTLGK